MFRATKAAPAIHDVSFAQAATVMQVDGNRLCRIVLAHATVWAMPALADDYAPAVGDRVLVIGNGADEYYVIGTLTRRDRSLKMRSGAHARVVEKDGAERLQVHDEHGRLVFEYHAGGATVSLPHGDLSLAAPNGNINLMAAGAIVCSSAGPAVIRSRSAIDLRVATSGVQLTDETVAIDGAHVKVEARDLATKFERADVRGKKLTGTLQYATWVYERLETVAERLFERACNVYREATELHQTKAARVRTLAEDYQVSSEQIDVVARGDVKIDGKSINLG